ncbi:MAG: hypothetical protein AAF198_13350 [Pseudomonadota bacterium]
MASLVPTVAYLGSCRIATPLRHIEELGYANVERTLNYGFVHAPQEILQQAAYCWDGLEIPKWQWPYVSRNAWKVQSRKTYQKPEILFVEVSSAKNVLVHNRPVQLNYFSRFLNNLIGTEASKEVLTVIGNPEFQDVVALHCCELPSAQVAALRSLQIQRTDPAEIRDMIEKLNRYATKLVVVPHVDAVAENGLCIPARHSLKRQLLSACEALGIECFDPMKTVEGFTQRDCFDPFESNLTHYSAQFAKLLGEILAKTFLDAPRPSKSSMAESYLSHTSLLKRVSRRDLTSAELLKAPVALLRTAFRHRKSVANKGKVAQEILRRAQTLPIDLVVLAVSHAAKLPKDLKPEKRDAVYTALGLVDLLRFESSEALAQLHPKKINLLWDNYLQTQPDLKDIVVAFSCLSQSVDLPAPLSSKMQTLLRRYAKDRLEIGDQDSLDWLAELEIDGFTLPPEIRLFAARLAYFQTDWQKAVDHGLVALKDLPENKGGWIRLSRAARNIGLSKVVAQAEHRLSNLKDGTI